MAPMYDEPREPTEAEWRMRIDGRLGLADPEQAYYTDAHIRESLTLFRTLENPDARLLRTALEVYRESTHDPQLTRDIAEMMPSQPTATERTIDVQ